MSCSYTLTRVMPRPMVLMGEPPRNIAAAVPVSCISLRVRVGIGPAITPMRRTWTKWAKDHKGARDATYRHQSYGFEFWSPTGTVGVLFRAHPRVRAGRMMEFDFWHPSRRARLESTFTRCRRTSSSASRSRSLRRRGASALSKLRTTNCTSESSTGCLSGSKTPIHRFACYRARVIHRGSRLRAETHQCPPPRCGARTNTTAVAS